jgi:hypothetical protein
MIPDVQRNEYETAYCGMNRVISAPKTRDVMNNLVVIERAIARREGERERGREKERKTVCKQRRSLKTEMLCFKPKPEYDAASHIQPGPHGTLWD